MSNSASLSAAKRRRGGVPPPIGSPQGQPPMNASVNGLPPGLPANFRQLQPQVQQQLIRQLQQRMGASAPAVQPTLQKQNTSMPPPIATRPSSSFPYFTASVTGCWRWPIWCRRRRTSFGCSTRAWR